MNKLILLLLLPFCAVAQHDFKAIDNKVEWSHIFKQDISIEAMTQHLHTSFNHLNDLIITDNSIQGTTDYMPLITNTEYLSAGFSQPIKINYRIDFKEGRYKVTVNNIVFKGIIITISGVGDQSDLYADTALIRTRDGELRKNKQAQKVFTRLHDAFIKEFTYKAPEKW